MLSALKINYHPLTPIPMDTAQLKDSILELLMQEKARKEAEQNIKDADDISLMISEIVKSLKVAEYRIKDAATEIEFIKLDSIYENRDYFVYLQSVEDPDRDKFIGSGGYAAIEEKRQAEIKMYNEKVLLEIEQIKKQLTNFEAEKKYRKIATWISIIAAAAAILAIIF
jgi:hypothetical protein